MTFFSRPRMEKPESTRSVQPPDDDAVDRDAVDWPSCCCLIC
ncbi:hypothetical protein PF010_g31986 [Phytophthora fragariae]|uniref:Uncharacterized protein n=2 Tax=Phytophthora TaxID=4783 RepID=A0A6A3HDN9_9STRA|nr:hypothetical protein PF003_g33710 [Phytophthora fragariae]KAE8967035.1 hypothetical protein PR002_g28186 [Phytophthora rubi]KAE9055867.1 hypothetical protein PF010_g31986 [Phytophthora fragariae]